MARSQILTYPFGAKFSTNPQTYRDWGKDVPSSWPCRQYIHRGSYQQTAGGVNWWGESGFGNDNLDSAQSEGYPFKKSMTSKGLHFWMNTSSNGKQTSRWFDIGTGAGLTDGDTIQDTNTSSWMRMVTGIWFLFNGNDTTQTRDCYARVEHAAIRYVDKDKKVKFLNCTQKIGSLSLMSGVRGPNRVVFGYQLPQASREIVYDDDLDLKFLGVRVQLQLRRGASGTSTDTVQGGITSMMLSLGNCNTSNPISKQILVPYGAAAYQDFMYNRSKYQLETRM